MTKATDAYERALTLADMAAIRRLAMFIVMNLWPDGISLETYNQIVKKVRMEA